MKDVIKFKRGQIWYPTHNVHSTTGSVQSEYRPVLIISSDAGNQSSPVVTVAKLTTNLHKGLKSINVEIDADESFKNFRDSVVLCNQICTMNKSQLDRYICTLSDDKLVEIDKAISLSLGIELDDSNLDQSIHKVEKLVSKIETATKHNYEFKKAAADKIKSYSDKLDLLYKELASFYERLISNIDNQNKLVEFDNQKSIQKDIQTLSSNATKKQSNRKNRKWTKTQMYNFIQDKDNLDADAWAAKYGFDTVQKAQFTYYKIKSKYEALYAVDGGSFI